jgi:ribonuclease P protein component
MLARANRLVSGDDFRTTMKLGRKASADTIVVYLKRDLVSSQARFGFIVSKSVGNAVTRNLVKRRLRSAARQALPFVGEGATIVARALPVAGSADWNKLSLDFESTLRRLGVELAKE